MNIVIEFYLLLLGWIYYHSIDVKNTSYGYISTFFIMDIWWYMIPMSLIRQDLTYYLALSLPFVVSLVDSGISRSIQGIYTSYLYNVYIWILSTVPLIVNSYDSILSNWISCLGTCYVTILLLRNHYGRLMTVKNPIKDLFSMNIQVPLQIYTIALIWFNPSILSFIILMIQIYCKYDYEYSISQIIIMKALDAFTKYRGRSTPTIDPEEYRKNMEQLKSMGMTGSTVPNVELPKKRRVL